MSSGDAVCVQSVLIMPQLAPPFWKKGNTVGAEIYRYMTLSLPWYVVPHAW